MRRTSVVNAFIAEPPVEALDLGVLHWLAGPDDRQSDARLVAGIFAVLLTPILSRILPKRDMRVLALAAFLGFAGVFFLRSHNATSVDTWTLLQGSPTALFFMPLKAIILSGLSPARFLTAAGLSNFARVFCSAVGTSLASTA